MSLRSPLGQVRGLGAAGHGVEHWWRQRLTALALVPLSLWLVVGLLSAMGKSHSAVVSWVGQPHVSVLLLATVVVMFYHMQLGVQVVIEDYVHDERLKIAAQITLTFVTVLGGLLAVVSILKIAFGAA